MSWVSPLLVVAGTGLLGVACWQATKNDKGEQALMIVVAAGLLCMGVAL